MFPKNLMDINKELQLATNLHQQGKIYEAEIKYKKIISVFPDQFDSIHLLGVIESQKGNNETALKLIKQAIQINSKSPMAYNNLTNVCMSLKMFNEAQIYCEKALSLNPNYLEALSNKGKLLIQKKQYHEAKIFFLDLIRLHPNYAENYFNIAIVYKEFNKVSQAIKSYKEAIKIRPDFAVAHFNLANLYLVNNKEKMAKEHLETCLKLNYDLSKVYNNLGQVYESENSFENARTCYKNALELNAKEQKAKHNLINLDLKLSNWSNIKPYIKLFKDKNSFTEHGLPTNIHAILDNPELQKFCNENFLGYSPKNSKRNKLHKKKTKIKLGYFSADFSDNNPVAYLITDLIKYHNRNEFDVYGFSLKDQKIKDSTRHYYENHFDKFFDLQELRDEKIKDICDDLNLDIAIDLNGYTKFSRPAIFSQKLAPIQINYLGYPGTLGSKNYDYIIADKTVIPEKLKKYYTEKIIYLPNTYFVNPSLRPISSKSFTKEDLLIDQNSFVYCCFNQNYKIMPDVFDAWMNILRNVDHSILILAHTNDTAMANLKYEANKRSINPNRIRFINYLKNIGDHLKRYEVADLFLDTMPYNAHTTASDSIWAGVPLITCKGRSFASRVSSSILNSVGLNDLITNSIEEYQEKAIEIGNNRQLLLQFRNKIIFKREELILFDSKEYTKNLEISFKKAFENFKSGNIAIDIEF